MIDLGAYTIKNMLNKDANPPAKAAPKKKGEEMKASSCQIKGQNRVK